MPSSRCNCEVSKREIILAILILVAYLAPSELWHNDILAGLRLENRNDRGNDDNSDAMQKHIHENEDTRGWKPPMPQTTLLGLYKNPREIVHVIHTRFMQHQPHLDSLGMARVELFKTFTLPSILKQSASSEDFLWIVWMEPELDAKVKQAFLQLVKPIPNCIVLGSNAKMPFIRADFYDELLESRIYSGNADLLQDYHEASLSRIVLHTELDADDAIFYDFVRSIQRDAAKTLKHSNYKYDFRLWCAKKRLEWNYYDPRFDVVVQTNWTTAVGYIQSYESKKECPPGGYTKGFGVVTDTTDLPSLGRYVVHTKTPTCDFTAHKCIDRIYGGASEYAVLRARTPTAHGMTDVMPKQKKTNKNNADGDSDEQDEKELAKQQEQQQQDYWTKFHKHFGVNQTQVVQCREVLEKDMVNIILQNLEGQCKDGFSCKHSTKDHLKELKKEYKQGDKQSEEENQQPKSSQAAGGDADADDDNDRSHDWNDAIVNEEEDSSVLDSQNDNDKNNEEDEEGNNEENGDEGGGDTKIDNGGAVNPYMEEEEGVDPDNEDDYNTEEGGNNEEEENGNGD